MNKPSAHDDLMQAAIRSVEMGDELVHAGRYDGAAAVVMVTAYAVATDPDLFCAAVDLLQANGDHAQAARLIVEAVQRFPGHARLRELLAAGAAPAGADRLERLRRAYEADRTNRAVVLDYAQELRQRRHRAAFCAVLLEHLTRNPLDEEARLFAATPLPAGAA